MCKAIMEQRNGILEEFNESMEECLKKLKQTGVYDAPVVMVDLERLYISNREYFEHHGFIFESQNRNVNERIKFYAWMQLAGDGELAKECWKKVREAKKEFISNQRKKICSLLREAQGCQILVDLNELCFENKVYFEECGYSFDPETKVEDGKIKYLVRMRKRR